MTDFSLPGLGPLAWIDVVLLGWFLVITHIFVCSLETQMTKQLCRPEVAGTCG